jgi:MtN3 and saliva related transmembrane protein
MSILATLATVVGAIGSISGFAQVYKIFKRKSAKDISILLYIFLIPSAIVWVLYGSEINSLAVILTNAIWLVVFIFIALGWYLYGR